MNIIDYLKWRGDLSLKVDPFNEVDNLCIAQMSYTKFDKYLNVKDELTIGELSDLYFSHHTVSEVKKSKSFVGSAPQVLKQMSKTKRFSSMKVHHFVSISNKEKTEQFCAFQVDLDSKTTYVVFRGTDDTLYGWQEDFNLSYEITNAQKSSADYVNKYLKGNRKYIFGGHSKGGNLAIFAATRAMKRIRKKITLIYSNDGPGLNDLFTNYDEIADLYGRYIKIVPSFDFFGTLFDSEFADHIIIKSDELLMLQHDAMSWQVEGNRFIRANKLEPESLVIKKGMNDFLKDVNLEQRKEFVDFVFAALDELHVKNITDFNKVSFVALVNALKKLMSMDESTKKTATKLSKVFTDLIGYEANEVISNVSEKIGTIFKQ